MPAEAKGPRLWFKRGNVGSNGKRRPGTWTIKDDGGVRVSTGVRAARGGKPPQDAQDALARYVIGKREIPRDKLRSADSIAIADVLNLYLTERAPNQADPAGASRRCDALLDFWGKKRLSDISGRTCREYAAFRKKPVARRELEDLRAAIYYHRKEGYCREIVMVTLPDPGPPRDRWLTRPEAARLIRAAWRFAEVHHNPYRVRYARRHVARFILVALYTGTRASAVCGASLGPVQSGGWIDLERGVFYRRGREERETKKARPPVPLPPRLIAHLRRWRANGQAYAVEWCGKRIDTVEKAFARTCVDADLPDVSPHTLRHTAATWLMQRGTDLWEAAGYLGMTAKTLEKVYGHHHPDHLSGAVANITRKA